MVARYGLLGRVCDDGAGEHDHPGAFGDHYAARRVLGRAGADVAVGSDFGGWIGIDFWIEPLLLVFVYGGPDGFDALRKMVFVAAGAVGVG